MAVELDVRLVPDHHCSDAEIAAAVDSALTWHMLVPEERIKVMVERGWFTLSGEVDWDYQRERAQKAVRPQTGLRGVTNEITLEPEVSPGNISKRIHEALARKVEHQAEREAEREAKGIDDVVSGHAVTLMGQVHSWSERTAAEGAAWSAPGITSVVNQLRIV